LIKNVSEERALSLIDNEGSLRPFAATVNHGGVQATLQNIQQQLQAIQTQNQITQAQLRNSRLVQYNGKQVCEEHQLEPLEVEDDGGPHPVGTRPTLMTNGGVFPETVGRLQAMTGQEIDNIIAFYHHNFGIAAGDRLTVKIGKVRKFIGR
jgi:hypothetical protein